MNPTTLDTTTIQLVSLIILVTFVVFAFLIPDAVSKKKLTKHISSLKKGDVVFTKSGLRGRIVEINDNLLVVEIGKAKTRLEIAKWGIASVKQ